MCCFVYIINYLDMGNIEVPTLFLYSSVINVIINPICRGLVCFANFG